MCAEEQRAVKAEAYEEARRYLQNARDAYAKARKKGRFFDDRKYVRGAGHYAYHAVLIALECLLKLNGVGLPRKKDIDFYRKEIGRIDKKLLRTLNAAKMCCTFPQAMTVCCLWT